ncbi:MAG TPA: FoF1 ATP synthase subunit a [Roseiflexaceae bacterium]|nr:FoF1 ATP synthase subunit a [Roseiflexaceae bacterium]
MRNRILAFLGVSLVIGVIFYILGIKLTRADLAISAAAEPIWCLGGVLEGEHCASGFPITNSLIMTVVVDLLLLLTIVFGARNMQLVPRGFQNFVEWMVEAFYNFAQGVDRKNVGKFFPMCATIFFFVLYSNFFALVPGVGSIGSCVEAHAAETESTTAEGAQDHSGATETAPATETEHPSPIFAGLPGYCENGHVVPILRSPSADLNVTLAFALAAVFMIEVFGFQALGVGYLTKFFNFKEGAMGFVVGILELVSEFVRIIAFAFRLFGNIFAGEVVLIVMAFLFPYLLPLPFYGLELFVAFMQAVIFSVLTLVFMTLATQAHGGHDEHGHPETMPIEAADLPGHGGSH